MFFVLTLRLTVLFFLAKIISMLLRCKIRFLKVGSHSLSTAMIRLSKVLNLPMLLERRFGVFSSILRVLVDLLILLRSVG